MTERDSSAEQEPLEQGLAEFLERFADTKRSWELEEMVRDLIPPDAGTTPLGDAFADAIISRLETTADGVSALHVMGLVAMPLVALKARSAVERAIAAGGPKPSALARRCGGLAPTEAWLLGGDGRDAAYLLVCRRPNAKRVQLAIVATIDVGEGPILVDAGFAAPISEADIPDLLLAFSLDGEAPVSVPLAQVGAQFVSLATNNVATEHGPTAEALPILSGLIAHLDVPDWEGLVTALAQLPLADRPDDDEGEGWDDDSDNVGMATRIAGRANLEGIDPSQAEELQAWMADFNARPIEERAELIPDSVVGQPPGPIVGQAWAGDAPRPKRRQEHAARKRARRRGR